MGTPRLQVGSSCDKLQEPEPLSPLRGEGWDGGDKGFMVHLQSRPAERRYCLCGQVGNEADTCPLSSLLSPGPVLQLADKLEISSLPFSSTVKTLEEIERNQILKTLSEIRRRIEGKDGAAEILGLHPSTIKSEDA